MSSAPQADLDRTAKTMNAIHATENNTVLARNRPKPLRSSPIAAATTSTAPTCSRALAALAATSKELGTGVLQRGGESPTRT